MSGLLFGSMIAGRIGDVFGRKPTLLIGLIVACLGSASGALCHDYYSFAATRFITALGECNAPESRNDCA